MKLRLIVVLGPVRRAAAIGKRERGFGKMGVELFKMACVWCVGKFST